MQIAYALFVSMTFCVIKIQAENFSFANFISHSSLAENSGHIQSASVTYKVMEKFESTNSANLCMLSHRYCDLMYLTDSTSIQKILLKDALSCALQAVKVDPENANAHICLAVCYAKNCELSDIKAKLKYSHLFKNECDKAIELDPEQNLAYYLLGRWNYGFANLDFFSRTYVRTFYGGLPKASNEDAVKNFEKAVELAPLSIINHAGLAMAYEKTGQNQLERQEFEKCCQLKPLDRENADAQKSAKEKLLTFK